MKFEVFEAVAPAIICAGRHAITHIECSALLMPQAVVHTFGDICIAYGESDEYSFVFRKGTTLYGEATI